MKVIVEFDSAKILIKNAKIPTNSTVNATETKIEVRKFLCIFIIIKQPALHHFMPLSLVKCLQFYIT